MSCFSCDTGCSVQDHGIQLLPFQKEWFENIYTTDGLVVAAAGLGLDRVIHNFLKVYTESTSLVLVLNLTPDEVLYHMDQLNLGKPKKAPLIIGKDDTSDKRHEFYLQGGVIFATSRIIVMDMLTKKMPVEFVSGIVLCNAHRAVASTCTEAFILRLYRMSNRSGFIKAFSDNPVAIGTGFNGAEQILKTLWVKRLHLWPRFHKNIVKFLADFPVDVVEVSVKMSASMAKIQGAISELLSATVKELQKACLKFNLEIEDKVNDDIMLSVQFHNKIRKKLDPVWHLLAPKTKQLISDINTLRELSDHLFQYDCVSFFHYLEILRLSNDTFNQNTLWLFLDATDDLFANAKYRVFKKPKTTDPSKTDPVSRAPEFEFEPQPKWAVLGSVLKDIAESSIPGALTTPKKIMVVTGNGKTATQLQRYLTLGPAALLHLQARSYIKWKGGSFAG